MKDISLELTNEELFCFEMSRGSTKSDAFRAIRDCSKMSDNTIHQLAWRYSNQPHVVALLSKMDDNSFIEHIEIRKRMLRILAELAEDSDSDFVRQQSANSILSQTAKATKLQVEHSIDNSSAELLEELRSTLLGNPPTKLVEGEKHLYNSQQKTEEVSESNLNDEYTDAEIVEVVMFEGREATMEDWKEQCEGINPTYAKGTTDRDTGSNTGCFRLSTTGFFISNEKAKEMLMAQEVGGIDSIVDETNV